MGGRNAGLYSALVIVIVANVITLITGLLSCTSQRVGVGGAYYLISRALGVEMGAAIGLPLYLSQAVLSRCIVTPSLNPFRFYGLRFLCNSLQVCSLCL